MTCPFSIENALHESVNPLHYMGLFRNVYTSTEKYNEDSSRTTSWYCIAKFNVLLTVYHTMILGNCPT